MAGHCVMNLSDLKLLYQGSDAVKAAAAAVEGSHWTEGPTISAAIFRCAAEVGCIRRGEMSARTGRIAPSPHAHAASGVPVGR
jgi:hypothetical protein